MLLKKNWRARGFRASGLEGMSTRRRTTTGLLCAKTEGIDNARTGTPDPSPAEIHPSANNSKKSEINGGRSFRFWELLIRFRFSCPRRKLEKKEGSLVPAQSNASLSNQPDGTLRGRKRAFRTWGRSERIGGQGRARFQIPMNFSSPRVGIRGQKTFSL